MTTTTPRTLQPLCRRSVLTTGDLARICGVAPRTVAKWHTAGTLPGYRIPGCLDRRFRREAVMKFLKEHGFPVPPDLMTPVVVFVGRRPLDVVGCESVHAPTLLSVGFVVAGRHVVAAVVDGGGLGRADALAVGTRLAALEVRPTLIGLCPEDLPDGEPWHAAGFDRVLRQPVTDAEVADVLGRVVDKGGAP